MYLILLTLFLLGSAEKINKNDLFPEPLPFQPIQFQIEVDHQIVENQIFEGSGQEIEGSGEGSGEGESEVNVNVPFNLQELNENEVRNEVFKSADPQETTIKVTPTTTIQTTQQSTTKTTTTTTLPMIEEIEKSVELEEQCQPTPCCSLDTSQIPSNAWMHPLGETPEIAAIPKGSNTYPDTTLLVVDLSKCFPLSIEHQFGCTEIAYGGHYPLRCVHGHFRHGLFPSMLISAVKCGSCYRYRGFW